MPDVEEVLGQVTIFAGVKPKELRKLAKEAHEVSFAAGKTLTQADGFGTTFFVVLEGSLAVIVKDEKVGDLGPGDYLGEMALIDKDTRSATVTALTDTKCLVFSRPVFRPFAHNHPEVAWALLERMVSRVREAESRNSD